jgi:hypothetical protein
MLVIHRAVYLTILPSGAPFLLHTAACNLADRNKDVPPFSPFNGGGGEGGNTWRRLAYVRHPYIVRFNNIMSQYVETPYDIFRSLQATEKCLLID